MKDRIPFFSREGKKSRAAKINLKRLLFRIALPNGISLEEKILIESIIDDIIAARMEAQVMLLEEFQRRNQNEMIELMKEERENIMNLIEERFKEIEKRVK